MRKRADAVELGHVEIEKDDVGLHPVDELDRCPAVRGGADHVELAALSEPARHQSAHDGGIVHDHDPGAGRARRRWQGGGGSAHEKSRAEQRLGRRQNPF
jgi:hypothetical protein